MTFHGTCKGCGRESDLETRHYCLRCDELRYEARMAALDDRDQDGEAGR